MMIVIPAAIAEKLVTRFFRRMRRPGAGTARRTWQNIMNFYNNGIAALPVIQAPKWILLMGVPDVGKSFLASRLVQRLSRDILTDN